MASRYSSTLVAVLMVVAVSAAGCGNPTSPSVATSTASAVNDVLAKAESLGGQQQLDFLAGQAKNESGPLRLYTSYSADSIDALTKAFEDKFGLEIASYRASSQDVSRRVHQETQAGYREGADFVEMRGLELHQLNEEGVIRGFKGDFDAEIPDYSTNGSWTADRLNVIVPCWNTDLVKPDQVPTSWQDLADPRWKGKLVIEQADDNWFQTLHGYLVHQGMTDEQADDYFRTIVANGTVVKGHTEMQTFIAAGQHAVGVDCYTYVTEKQMADGAHTAWQPAVQPAIVQPNGIAVMKTAQHPASAALFYRWILTDGQEILARTGNAAVTKTDVSHGLPLDIEGYSKDPDTWRDRYDRILTGR
jgi:iron(III) transport system substrate-binding protein